MSQENSPETETQEETSQETKSDDLDTLLSEYESSEEETKSEVKPEVKDETVSQLKQRLEDIERQNIQKETRQAIDEAIQTIKSDGVELTDMQVEGYLQVMASRDPRLVSAFQQRYSKPAEFKKVLSSVAETIRSDVGPDKKLSDDSEAVRQAVKGQDDKVTTEDKPDVSQMSDKEFREYKAGLLQ